MINSDFEISNLTFDQILPIWSAELWPNRQTPIETHSAMVFNKPNEYHSLEMFRLPIQYYGVLENGTCIGVNSVHACPDNAIRIRGLWVHPDRRGSGIATALIRHAVAYTASSSADYVWGFVRRSAWPVFQKVGFTLSSDWIVSETSPANAYCRLVLNNQLK